MSKSIYLETNEADVLASSLRATLPMLFPGIGDFLSEIISYFIPNQKMDRVVKCLKDVQYKIQSLPEEVLNRIKNDQGFLNMINEAVVQSAKALSDEKIEYLQTVLLNGLTSEDVSYQRSINLLKLIGSLDPVEIIWLRYYLIPTMQGDEEFRTKNQHVLQKIRRHTESSEEELLLANEQERYRDHLVQENLLEPIERAKIIGPDRKEIFNYRVTALGKFLLKQLNLYIEFSIE